MEVRRLGVASELHLLTCATTTATQNLSCVCKLHHHSLQLRVLNPLSEARDQTLNLMGTSQIRLVPQQEPQDICLSIGHPKFYYTFTAMLINLCIDYDFPE